MRISQRDPGNRYPVPNCWCRKDFALKRWAEALAERVGKTKALVALARKLAVLLHRLWVTGETFRPFPETA